MKLTIEPSYMTLSGTPSVLDRVHHKYSFQDLQAEYLIARFDRRMEWSLRSGSWHTKFNSKQEFLAWQKTKREELENKLVIFCCTKIDDFTLRVPVGLFQNLTQDFSGLGLKCQIQDNRNFDLPKRNLIGTCPKLRPPQEAAIKTMILHPVCMLRMATGVGKTMIGQEIIRHFGVKSIFLVPSRPILHQTVDRFRSAFGSRFIGKVGDGKNKHSQITVATYQSVYSGDPDDFLDYDLVIADECHHVPADTYYEVVENRLQNAVYRYGLTADEDRSDGGTILVEAATGPVVFSYEAPQAIREGYLAQPTFIIYEILRTEGTHIKWITNDQEERVADGIIQSEAYGGDDPHPAYKNWILGNDLANEAIANIVAAFKDQNMNVLILIDEKEHGDKLMRYLRSHGAVLVTGETEGNQIALASFNQRELKIILATSTFGEGTDTITVDVLVNLMGGKRVKQANGRALRNDPDDNGIPRKPKCLIIDVDVPRSPVLSRHCGLRENTHKTCGPVYRRPLL